MAQHRTSERSRLPGLVLGAALTLGLGAVVLMARRRLANGRSAPAAPPPTPRSGPIATQGEALCLAQILIPVANPDTAQALIQVASALGAAEPPAELIALKIVTAPQGVPLDEARRYILSMREQYEGALAQAAAWAREQSVDLRSELVVARAVAPGILAFANELADPGLILLGWRGAVSLRRVRRSINQEIVRRARTNVAVLRVRARGPIRRVLLPLGWGPHARFGLRLAARLVQNEGVALTVLRVLPTVGEVDWEGERSALLQLLAEEAPALRYDTELRLVREAAAVPAILAEARREPYDLIIIGASDEWWLRNWLFGAIPDLIAEQAPCSVLLVRRHQPGLI